MGNNKNEGLGNKPIIVIIGLIASCIAIFVFFTGKQNIFDVISTLIYRPITQNTPIVFSSTSTPQQITPTIIAETPTKSIQEPTSTPMVVDSNNTGVSITISDSSISSGDGTIRIQFLSANQPLRNVSIWFHKAAQDITGKWTLIEGVTRNGYMVSGKTDQNGTYEDTLAPGNYAAWNQDYSAVWNQLNGTWGVKAYYFDQKDPYQTILFPVQAGKLTDIKLSLAHLEIGLISKKDGSALKETLVYLNCQGKDVANKNIPTDCGDGESVHKTDDTGLTSFNVGAGVYAIGVECYYPATCNYSQADLNYFYDISIGPGENKRIVLTAP